MAILVSNVDSLTKNAADLFKIAVNIAGFNAGEVMIEINRLQRACDARANCATVEKALQNVSERYKEKV